MPLLQAAYHHLRFICKGGFLIPSHSYKHTFTPRGEGNLLPYKREREWPKSEPAVKSTGHSIDFAGARISPQEPSTDSKQRHSTVIIYWRLDFNLFYSLSVYYIFIFSTGSKKLAHSCFWASQINEEIWQTFEIKGTATSTKFWQGISIILKTARTELWTCGSMILFY